jgi:hypothetical protein
MILVLNSFKKTYIVKNVTNTEIDVLRALFSIYNNNFKNIEDSKNKGFNNFFDFKNTVNDLFFIVDSYIVEEDCIVLQKNNQEIITKLYDIVKINNDNQKSNLIKPNQDNSININDFLSFINILEKGL